MAVQLDVGQAVLLGPGEGEAVADSPAKTLRLLADFDELALTWFRYPAHLDGPERHIHETHVDAFYVLSGEVSFRLGPDPDHAIQGTPGTFVAAPAGVVHTFANESAEEVTFLNIARGHKLRDVKELDWWIFVIRSLSINVGNHTIGGSEVDANNIAR